MWLIRVEKENSFEFIDVIALGCWKVSDLAAVLCFQAEQFVPILRIHTIVRFGGIALADR